MDASIAPVRACAQHVSSINFLAQGIKAWGEDSSFSLLHSLFDVEPVVAGHKVSFSYSVRILRPLMWSKFFCYELYSSVTGMQ